MADMDPAKDGMQTLQRLAWLLLALSVVAMSADSGGSSGHHHRQNDFAVDNSPQARDPLSLQNRYPRSDEPQMNYGPLLQSIDNVEKLPRGTHSQISRPQHDSISSQPHPKLFDHRRKKHRGKKKSRPGRREKSARKTQLHSRNRQSSSAKETRYGKSNEDARHSKTQIESHFSERENVRVSNETSARTSNDSTNTPAASSGQSISRGLHQFRNVHDSYRDLLQTREDYYKKERSKVLGGQHQQTSPQSYKYDPFLNPPADRYERVTLTERPIPETTTVLPHFIPDGSSPIVPDPFFLQGKSKIVAHEGGMAILPCAVKYLEMKEVSWSKVGREHLLSIGPDVWVRDSRYSVEYLEGPEAEVSHWNLKVKKVALEDEGAYQCQVIATERMIRTVRLEIIEKPPYNPVITIEGKKFVESAHTAYIRCNATEGNRFPEDIDWFKNGDKIDSLTYPNIVITKYRSEMTLTLVSELAITKASAKDSGTYICRSSTELIASLDVNVLVADKSNVKRGHFSNETRLADTHTGTIKGSKENGCLGKHSGSGNELYIALICIVFLFGRDMKI